MGHYASRTVIVNYGWKGVAVKTEVSVPYGDEGREMIDFIGRLISELSEQHVKAETMLATNIRERVIGPFGGTKIKEPRMQSVVDVPSETDITKEK